MRKDEALRVLAGITTPEDLFVTSVGPVIDDWWNIRPGHCDNTISLSALGSVTPLAMGLALALPNRRVIALDSDGSALMNLGAYATAAAARPRNLTILVCDNQMYESVGSVPTLTAAGIDLAAVGRAVSISHSESAEDEAVLESSLKIALDDDDVSMVVAQLEPGITEWPTEKRRDTDGVEDKFRFIRYVEELEGIQIHNAIPPHV